MSGSMESNPRVGRRDALKLGGLTVSLAALVAACGDDLGGPDDPGRVGYAPPVTDPPDYPVDDAVLLRTASSIELTAAYTLGRLLEIGDVDAQAASLIERLISNHETLAEEMGTLTDSAGGEAWECTNDWMMERLIEPLLSAIETNDDATQAANVLDAAITVENWTAATNQAFTTALSEERFSEASLAAAVTQSRQAAALVAATRGAEGYLSPALGGAEPENSTEGLPPQVAVFNRFGTTGQFELVAGRADENGVRQTFVFQTPSLNSYVYNELSPSC